MANTNEVVNATENTGEKKVGFWKKHGKTIRLVAGTALVGIAAGFGLGTLFGSKKNQTAPTEYSDNYDSDDEGID